jgi:hypothetical protein
LLILASHVPAYLTGCSLRPALHGTLHTRWGFLDSILRNWHSFLGSPFSYAVVADIVTRAPVLDKPGSTGSYMSS